MAIIFMCELHKSFQLAVSIFSHPNGRQKSNVNPNRRCDKGTLLPA